MPFLDQRFRPKEGLEAEDTGHEVLIFLVGSNQTLYLNDTAAILWRLCDGTLKGSDMVAILVEAYPDAAAVIPTEVAETLQDFLDKGLIEAHG